MNANTIEEASALYGALTGQAYRVTTDFNEVLAALDAGSTSVLVELPWREARNGELHDRHQIILERRDQGRVVFVNALHTDVPPGTELGGPGKGPMRRAERVGVESMDEKTLKALFVMGGKGMLPAN